jgi:hypothetical protein
MKTNYYVGPELNYTPANGMQTVYTCQFKTAEQIDEIAKQNNAKHIRLGYLDTTQKNKLYNEVITELLNKGYKVSLEYQPHLEETLKELIDSKIWIHHNFIPLIKIKYNFNLHTANASFILEDINNTEVSWSGNLKDMMDSNKYSDQVNEYIKPVKE